MTDELKKICEQIAALPEDKALGYPVMTGMVVEGYNSARMTTDDLKALASHALRVEKMLGRVAEIRGFSWHIIRRRENNQDEWLSTSAVDGMVLGPFTDAPSAFEATQNVSDGRKTQET